MKSPCWVKTSEFLCSQDLFDLFPRRSNNGIDIFTSMDSSYHTTTITYLTPSFSLPKPLNRPLPFHPFPPLHPQPPQQPNSTSKSPQNTHNLVSSICSSRLILFKLRGFWFLVFGRGVSGYESRDEGGSGEEGGKRREGGREGGRRGMGGDIW